MKVENCESVKVCVWEEISREKIVLRLLPRVRFILFFYLAFSRWKSERLTSNAGRQSRDRDRERERLEYFLSFFAVKYHPRERGREHVPIYATAYLSKRLRLLRLRFPWRNELYSTRDRGEIAREEEDKVKTLSGFRPCQSLHEVSQ